MRVAIPHTLDKAEVRRRLTDRMPDLPGFIPGGLATVDHEWTDEDHMRLSVTALGQSVVTRLDVEERQVVVNIEVPAALGFMGGAIEKAVRDQTTRLLR
jgi:hypothetical protein